MKFSCVLLGFTYQNKQEFRNLPVKLTLSCKFLFL